MVWARDNPAGQALADAFDPDDKPLLVALCKNYEGEKPTARQKNPHPPTHWPLQHEGDFPEISLVVARLGAQKYHAIKYRRQISAGIV